ncbi:hypothetical protein HMPREF2826_05160 [Olsenella sp. HMSC062G07]|nr:hypothetical protein HMPREF2826_05160 [Olsenella sp. HMSC062G07]
MTNRIGGYRLPALDDSEGYGRANNTDVHALGDSSLFAERQRLLNALARTERNRPRDFNRMIPTPSGPMHFSEWATERIRLINSELARR